MAPRAPLPACGERQGEGLGEWPLCRREARPFRSIAQIAGSRRLGMKSGARRRNHRAASGGGAAARGRRRERRMVRFAAHGAQRSAWRRRRRPNRPRAAPFSGDRLLSTACEAIFFRLAARRGPRSPADAGPLRG